MSYDMLQRIEWSAMRSGSANPSKRREVREKISNANRGGSWKDKEAMRKHMAEISSKGAEAMNKKREENPEWYQEIVRKQAEKMKGMIFTEEHKRNIKLHHHDCSGKNGSFYGRHHSEEQKIAMSLIHKGKPLTEEHKRHLKENHASKKPNFVPPMLGKHLSEEAKEKVRKKMLGRPVTWGAKISAATKGKKGMPGNKNPNWKGGGSYEPYGQEFDDKLREQIRKRDQNRCQECFRHQSELKRKLAIHHIDFNKKNNNPDNLISLCDACHAQTFYDRDDWVEYFQDRRGGAL